MSVTHHQLPLGVFSLKDSPIQAEKVSLIHATAKILRCGQICAFTAGSFWTMLHFRDLKKVGKLRSGWVKILGIFGETTLAFGPGRPW